MCYATSSSAVLPGALSQSLSPYEGMTDRTVRLTVTPGSCQSGGLHPQTLPLPFGGQACHFSPFSPYRLAVVASQLFGICGEGRLLVVEFSNNTVDQPAVVRATGHNERVRRARQSSAVPFRLEVQTQSTSSPFVPCAAQKGAALTALEPTDHGARRNDAFADTAEESAESNLRATAVLSTRDIINDCAWSPKLRNLLAAACGDGAVRVWNLPPDSPPSSSYSNGSLAYTAGEASAPARGAGFPLAADITAHQAEVCSVDWSPRHPQVLLSASWDATARLWDVFRPQHLLRCLRHPQCVYAAQFSPHIAAVIGSVSADGRLRIFDLHMPPRKEEKPALESGFLCSSLRAHGCELLCLDWSHFNTSQIFTGATDGCISCWDMRQFAGGPLMSMQAHSLAVRAVRCSPFDHATVATASYDTTVKIHYLVNSSTAQPRGVTSAVGELVEEGSFAQQGGLDLPEHRRTRRLCSVATAASPMLHSGSCSGNSVSREPIILAHHTEFVLGLDWSPFYPYLLASTSWDRTLCLWNVPDSTGGRLLRTSTFNKPPP